MNLHWLKNMSLSFKISFLALITILSISLVANVFFKGKTLQENLEFFQNSAEQCLDSIANDLNSGNVAGACDIMKKAFDRKLTSFFIIQAAGIPLCFAPLNQADAINLNYHRFNEVIHLPGDQYDFKSIKVKKFVVTTGWLNNSGANFLNFFFLKLPTIILGVLISVLSIAIIVFRETRLIKKLLLVFKRSERVSDNMEPPKKSVLAPAVEIQKLWSSALEIQKKTDSLKIENQYVADDAQNALRKEVVSTNKKIPFQFSSCILRFDMNNYTKTFIEDPEATQRLITRLSIEADELIHRYGGLHYGFGGDEFIVVFRKFEYLDSRALAFSCIRDLFSKIEEVFTIENGFQKLTLKAAISHSENVLFKLPNGLFLRGLNLILSQRYLTTVIDKGVNKIVLNAEDLPYLKDLSDFAQPNKQQLKGIVGDFDLCEQTQFKSLDEILASKMLQLIRFYRSDADISKFFSSLSSGDIELSMKFEILEHLKIFRVERMSKRAATDFLKCFATLDKAFAKNKVLLAGLLVSAENLIPKDSWTDEMSHAVLNANCKEDSRCNSHILQLLAFKAPRESFERFAESILKFAKGPDFRSVGNYMILKAQNGLTDELLNTCKKMLKSKIELEVATGIYVSSKIIQDQRERDAVALSQFGQVPNLIFKIRGLQKSESAMISTRAFVEMRELESLENAEQTI